MGGVGHVSAARACGRIDVGRRARAVGWVVDVWFVLVIGIDIMRRGRVRMMGKKISVFKWRESIVVLAVGMVS